MDVTYEIDAEDTIVAVGGAWEGPADVVGDSLWDHVDGEDVRAIWELLLRRARAGRAPLLVPCRCDAPGVRRLMQMELAPRADGGVAFRSRQVYASGARTLVGRWGRAGDAAALTVCGWCGRVHAEEWISPEAALDRIGIDWDARAPRLSHGICPCCAGELRLLARSG